MFGLNRPAFAFRPLKGDGLGVVGGKKLIDGLPQLVHAGETGPAKRLPRQQADPDFHLVEPRGVRGVEVQMHLRMLPQPAVPLGFHEY